MIIGVAYPNPSKESGTEYLIHQMDFDEVLDFLKDLPKMGVFLGSPRREKLKQILGPLYPKEECA